MLPVEMATAVLEALSEATALSDVADARRIYCRVLFNAAIAREMDRELVVAQAAELPEIAARLEAFGLIDEGLSARFTYADNVLVGEARILAQGSWRSGRQL